jgi:hypothetical protein
MPTCYKNRHAAAAPVFGERLQKDYYQRLIYTAADRSERMLTDVLRHGVLAHHPGRYRVRQIDAMEPGLLGRDISFSQGGPPHPQPLSPHGRDAAIPC